MRSPAPGVKNDLDSNCGAFTASPVTPVGSSLPTLLPLSKTTNFSLSLGRQGSQVLTKLNMFSLFPLTEYSSTFSGKQGPCG